MLSLDSIAFVRLGIEFRVEEFRNCLNQILQCTLKLITGSLLGMKIDRHGQAKILTPE